MTEQAQYSAIDIEWLECKRKKAFRSAAKARKFERKYRHIFGRQTVYPCKVGPGTHYHLTTRYHKTKQ